MNSRNNLYPIFLKLEKLEILMVGAGEVGGEKLRFLLKSSPEAKVKIVAPEVKEEVYSYLEKYDNLTYVKKKFEPSDLADKDLAIAATCFEELNHSVWQEAKKRKVLINVADTPDLCDFYLGSIVTRGDLKVAISTNGKSPTFAKRFRQLLEEILPDNTNDLLQNLHEFRNRLKGDFEHKVTELNKLTSSLLK